MKRIFNKIGLLLLMGAVVVLLGVSYAGYTDMLTTRVALSSGNMDLQFSDQDDYFSVEIQNGEEGKLKKLKANAEFDSKALKITDMDPVDMALLKEGDLRFIIRYGLKASDNSSILNASIGKNSKDNDVPESVTFERTTTTPQFIIKGNSKESDRWDNDSASGVASQVIYDLLPDSLGEFYVSKTLIVDENEEIMQGVIVLEQVDTPEWITADSILLSSLDMPNDVLDTMAGKGGLEFSLQGCYGFEIPLIIDQFNVERMH